MKPIDFIKKYHKAAQASEISTGINAIFSLAQSALETGWGERAPGNMMFGEKDWDGLNGNEQLIPTTEYSRFPHLTAKQVGLNSIDRIEWSESAHQFIYYGKAYFRKYNTPEESFEEHAKLFFKRDKLGRQPYAAALPFMHNVEKFVTLIAPIYASGPNYAALVISIMHTIQTLIKQYNL